MLDFFKRRSWRTYALLSAFALIVAGAMALWFQPLAIERALLPAATQEISYSEFRRLLSGGEIASGSLSGRTLSLRTTAGREFTSRVPENGEPEAVERLIAAGADVSVAPEFSGVWEMVVNVAVAFLIIGVFLIFLARMNGNPIATGRSRAQLVKRSQRAVSFADVA